MRKWIHKFIDQFEIDWKEEGSPIAVEKMSDDRATLLYLIDAYSKHLFDIKDMPIRKARESFDDFAKMLLQTENVNHEKLLFRFRQFFSNYRLDEYTYVQKTLDEFRGIIWDFVDQLSEDFRLERVEDQKIKDSLYELKEAVESDSIDDLKTQSREFIDNYIEYQTKRDERKNLRLEHVKTNLDVIKKKLVEANHDMRVDHLTQAYNRKSFDEQLNKHWRFYQASHTPVSLVMFDIDHFKRINDTYGHDVGDFILIELVKHVQQQFPREQDFLARIGGEEFAIILPDYQVQHVIQKAEKVLKSIEKEVWVYKEEKINFTVSMGIAEILPEEEASAWLKRADEALYHSKNTGRNRFTISPQNKAKLAKVS